jgi:hypothetical protein
VWYVYHRLIDRTDTGITSHRLPMSFTDAQAGLVVTQHVDAGIAPVAHDVPTTVASPLDLIGCRRHRGL